MCLPSTRAVTSVGCRMFIKGSFVQLCLFPKTKDLGKGALIRRDANFDIYVTLERIRILAVIGCLSF